MAKLEGAVFAPPMRPERCSASRVSRDQGVTDVQRLGTDRISTAVHWIADADVALKGGVSYGGKDLNTDMDVTELTVVEILVARLAKMSQGARRAR